EHAGGDRNQPVGLVFYSAGVKISRFLCRFAKIYAMAKINRLKSILVEKNLTNLWLASQLGVNSTTVSKWCTNSSQPDILMILRIAQLLDIGIKDFYDERIVDQYEVWQQ
ncbi:helix-turn-helix transcriptional regulator, partial [uncultured Duncaniella sp.]